jgi:aspartyl-tRNA(Asn)/glutamyl-tRNA(Gln) amidotransferase subunit C
MKVTPELVDKLARLSRLQFNKEELEEIRQDLEKMIAFIDKLNELDTTGVEPLLHLSPGQSGLREDAAGDMTDPSEALKNASGHKDGFFTVPAAVKKPGS